MFRDAYQLTRIILLSLFVTPATAAEHQHGHSQHSMSASAVTKDAKGPSQAETVVYTTNKDFLVKLLDVPTPIPYGQHFSLKFGIYDGKNPNNPAIDTKVKINVGMRHGSMDHFAHGMDSSPKLSFNTGVLTVDGMYFTMKGTWTIELLIKQHEKQDTATFELPCCRQ